MPVAVALGSNLGDRQSHLDYACAALSALVRNMRVSTVRESVPVDVPGVQPLFLNAAVVGETELGAHAFLDALQAIEQMRGRHRPFPGAARTLDLDLVLYGGAIIQDQRLSVPHPRFRERAFVLDPLDEIAPDWRDPVTQLTIRELRARCGLAPSSRSRCPGPC